MIKKIKKFSMIELAFAIAILAITSASVLSLFIVGLDQNRNSIGDNYSAISADDIYSYLSRISASNWSVLIDDIPSGKSSFSQSAYITNINNWGSPLIGNIYKPTPDDGVFGIKMSTENINDFSAEIRIWRNTLTDWYIPGEDGYTVSGETNINPSSSAKSTFEVTGVTVNGGTIDKAYLQTHEETYEGPAISIRIKGQNPDAELDVDETNIMDIKDDQKDLPGDYDRFTFSSSRTMQIKLWNPPPGSGMGNWELIFIDAAGVQIVPDPGYPKIPKTTAVFIEISWPINVSYRLRNKRTYYFEVFDMDNI